MLKEFKRVMKPVSEGIIITMSFGDKWYNELWYFLSKYFPSLLTNCCPVSLSNYIKDAGFKIEKIKAISQNTFASEIIKFSK